MSEVGEGRPSVVRGRRAIVALVCAGLLGPAACGEDDAVERGGPADAATTAEGRDQAGGDAEGDESVGSDEAESTGPPDRVLVRRAADAFLAATKASRVCRRVLSEEFLRTGYGSLSGCLEGRPAATLADGVAFRRTAIRGGEATVIAEPEGGLYDGEQVEIHLERSETGRWQITAVTVDVPVGP